MNIPLPKVHIILIFQVIVWGFAVITAHVVQGQEATISAGLGGAIAVLPNAIFAFMVFRIRGASRAKNIMRNVYWGEGLKFLATFLGFALAFIFFSDFILPTVFFIVYALVYTAHWFSALFVRM